jgi:non-canonical (house-cleaning) NTP pyrophosphatase
MRNNMNNIRRIVVGSASKRKIDMTAKVARDVFRDPTILVEGYAAVSGVPETPFDKETFDGARNRAQDAKRHAREAECYIGLESGLIERYGHVFEEAWCAVLIHGKEYFGYSSGLKVPDYILKRMDAQQKPHALIMTEIELEFTKTPSDTWGTYTGGQLLRETSLEEALRNALIQVIEAEGSLYHEVH